MRLWWHKRNSVDGDDAAPESTSAVAPVKAKKKRAPIAGVAGYMAISLEDGIQHPLAPRMKPHDERSDDSE